MEDTIDAVAVFRGATTLALKDGHLDDQEMRILARLSHALRLPEAVPVKIYDDILNEGESDLGRKTIKIRGNDRLRSGIRSILHDFRTHPRNSTAAVLYAHTVFDINETEHREFVRSVDRHLEQVVHRNVAAQLRTTIDDAIELVSEPTPKAEDKEMRFRHGP